LQVLTETVSLQVYPEYKGASLMMEGEETELIFRACSGDAGARLRLVKYYLNIVVETAGIFASETGAPFDVMVQAGTMAVMRAAYGYDLSQQIAFAEVVKSEILRAMDAAIHSQLDS